MKEKIEVSVEDKAIELGRILRLLEADDEVVSDRIAALKNAAIEEYLQMMLGERVFSRGSDIREYRLLLLIQHGFWSAVPDDIEVSRFFQTTISESRSLVRAVLAKYQYLLQSRMRDQIKAMLGSSGIDTDSGEYYTVALRSTALLQEIEKLTASFAEPVPAIRKKPGSTILYLVHTDTMKALKVELSNS